MEFNNSANPVHKAPIAAKDGWQWQDCYSFRELKHIFSVVIFFMMVSHASKVPYTILRIISYDPPFFMIISYDHFQKLRSVWQIEV